MVLCTPLEGPGQPVNCIASNTPALSECHCMSILWFRLCQSFSHEDRGKRCSFRARMIQKYFCPPPLPQRFLQTLTKNGKTTPTEFCNCFSERPSPLGFRPAGRSSLLAKMTAMPQRYSHHRRRTSAAAAARRMERKRREQGKNSTLASDHNNYRSKKLAMLSR